MVLPKILKGEVSVIGHLKAPTEQCLGVETLEVGNHLLVHRLYKQGGIGW